MKSSHNQKKNKQKTKVCHYVQQAYLKHFSISKDKNQLWVFDKSENKKLENSRSIKKIAYIDYFYPQWLEDKFAYGIEQKGYDRIKRLSMSKDPNVYKNLQN